MEWTPDIVIALAVLAPFVAAMLAPLVQRWCKPFAGWVLALVPAGIFVSLLGFLPTIAGGQVVAVSLEWIPAYNLALSFLLDGLSLTFALTISGVGALIVLYAASYLSGHPRLGRFLAFMLAFMGAMLGLVLADSMLALFMFWELTSVTSFLLIGFHNARQSSRRGAIQALVITNIGGMALLAGAILVNQMTGQWNISQLGGSLAGEPLYGAVLVLFLVAAFTKSAQFPFHFWLPNAMEAPTPVSAFLHSATMVQGGVYLLARMTPTLGDTPAWTITLMLFGGITLLWGALGAVRQTDLKQMLAQTTIASLGLLVLLLGLGSEAAISAMVVYFVAHALYKAALFMVAGAIDHETGTRDLTLLGGLSDAMPLTFIGTGLAAISMIGLPLTLGYLGKEEMYLALANPQWPHLLALAVLVVGNGLLAGVALAILLKPFIGARGKTPKSPHEAGIAMLAGPLVLGALGIVLALMTEQFGRDILVPAASSILGVPVQSHLTLALNPASIVFWLSVATWGLGVVVYLRLASLRTMLRRLSPKWTLDHGFDVAMFGLIRFAGAVTRWLHHGRLERYLVVIFACLGLVLFIPVIALGGFDRLLPFADPAGWVSRLTIPDLRLYEWGVFYIAIIGLIALTGARTRLSAILALGIQGTGVALIYLMFGAPDLAFTQFMVEILSVVILTLVMTRLRLHERDHREFEDMARDGTLAIVCGAGVSLLLMVVLTGTLDPRLSEFFTATSVPIAHGSNIVNVILVDYRGFDTLGEISVVMATGIAILALLRSQKRPAQPKHSVDQPVKAEAP